MGRKSDDALSLSWTPHTKPRAGMGAPDLASAMPALTMVEGQSGGQAVTPVKQRLLGCEHIKRSFGAVVALR